MEKARIGVIGTGAWGKNHARVYYELDNAELVAIADINESRAKLIASKYGAKSYTDFVEMLEKEDLDGVAIATPTTTHHKIGLKAMEYCKYVFIEKPLADTIRQGEELVEAAKKNNVRLTVGFITRFTQGIDTIKSLFYTEKFGKPVLLLARRVGPFWPERVGDVGVIKDTAIHDIDIFRFLLEKNPREVYATTGKLKHRYEDHATIILKFKDATGLIEANWLTPHKLRELSVTGEYGVITLDYMTQDLTLEGDLWFMKAKTKWREPLKDELSHFVDAIINEKEPLVSGYDGLVALKIAEYALESARKGEPIKLTGKL